MKLMHSIKAIHRRLLPDDPAVGWLPYLWLFYLIGFIVQTLVFLEGRDRAICLAASLLFLLPYFRGYWLKGRRLVPCLFAIILLALVVTPINPNAFMFFIFASGFSGRIGSPRAGLLVALGCMGAFIGEGLILRLPPAMMIFGAMMIVLIGVINIYGFQMALKNVQLRLSQKEVGHLASMAERERIARDLHDLLGHTLSVITLKAELAARLIDKNAGRARQEMCDVEQISRCALTQVREAVAGYRQQGLGGELANARLAFEALDITFDYQNPPLDLPPPTEAVLAMVVREAVTNVVRHSAATHCTIEFAPTNQRLEVTIRDNGQAQTMPQGGGITGMATRLQEIGGTLHMELNQGLTLRIDLPLLPTAA